MPLLQPQQQYAIDESAQMFKLLSSTSRLAILRTLIQYNDRLCVNEIADTVGLSQSATSHQLSKLVDNDVVECKRMGRTACYRFTNNDRALFIKQIIKRLV